MGCENLLEKEMATHCGTLAFENSMDREAWWATLDVVAMNQKGLRGFTFTFHAKVTGVESCTNVTG